MLTRIETYGLGGYDTAKPNNNVVATATRISEGLGADAPSIAANGVAFATLHCATTAQAAHNWSVNGAETAVTPTLDAATQLWCSEIEVTAVAAGPIDVTCNGFTLSLTAV